jgi:hypothetical protein
LLEFDKNPKEHSPLFHPTVQSSNFLPVSPTHVEKSNCSDYGCAQLYADDAEPQKAADRCTSNIKLMGKMQKLRSLSLSTGGINHYEINRLAVHFHMFIQLKFNLAQEC